MTTRILWQSESMWNGDIAQLTVNEESDQLAIITTDDGRPKAILISDEDAAELSKVLEKRLMLKAVDNISDSAPAREEYEKSEKDAMWERGD